MGRIMSLSYDELSPLFSELLSNLGFRVLGARADEESLMLVARSRQGEAYYIKVQDRFDEARVKKALDEAGKSAKAVLVSLSGKGGEDARGTGAEFMDMSVLIEHAKGYDLDGAIDRLLPQESVEHDEDEKKVRNEGNKEKVPMSAGGAGGGEGAESAVEPRETAKTLEERYAELSESEKAEVLKRIIDEARANVEGGDLELAYRNYSTVIRLEPAHVQAIHGAAGCLLALERFDEAVLLYNKLLSFKPESVEAWFDKGVALGHLGRYNEEIECYLRVLKLAPSHENAQNNMGVALQMLGKIDDALQIYDTIIASHPTNAQAWNNKGVALKKQGKFAEAMRCYNRAIELSPRRPEGYLNKGVLMMEQARYDEALKAFATMLVSNPNDEKALFALGRCKMLIGGENNLRAALEAFDKALDLNPNLDEAWEAYWDAVAKLAQFGYSHDDVLAEANAELRVDPHSMHAWFKKGRVHFERGDMQDAMDAFENVLSTNPYFIGALEYKGKILQSQNDLEGALRCFEDYTKTEPARSTGWVLRGKALHALGRLDEAMACFVEALRVNRKDSEALYYSGMTFESQGKVSDAIERYKDAIGADASNLPAYYRLGKALFSSGKFAESLEVYDYYLKQRSDDPKVLFERGKALLELGNIEESEKMFKRVLEMEPDNLDALFALGAVLESEGKYQDALACYDTVSATPSKDSIRLWANRGKVLFNQGMLDEALKCMNEALRLSESVLHGKELANLRTDAGILNYHLGNYDAALKLFDSAISSSKKLLRPIVNKGNALFMLGKISEAHEAYDDALKKDRNYLYAISQKELAFYDEGKYNDALEYAERMIMQFPTNILGWYAKGRALEGLGRHDDARKCFDKVISLEPDSQEAREIVHERLGVLDGSLDPSSIVEKCDEALSKYPSEPRLMHARAQALHILGDDENAKSSLSALLSAFEPDENGDVNRTPVAHLLSLLPRDARKRMRANVQNDLACAHYAMGEFDVAESLLREALKQTKAREPLVNLACVLYAKGALEESGEVFARACKADYYSICRNGIACVLARSGDLEGAKKELDEALSADDDAVYWSNRGFVCLALGQDEDALLNFGNAIGCARSKKQKCENAILGRMYARTRLRRFADAISDGLELSSSSKYSSDALNCLGYCYHQLFMLDEALDAYERSGTADSVVSRLGVLLILRRDVELLELLNANPALAERACELARLARLRIGEIDANGADAEYRIDQYKQPRPKSFSHASEC